MSSAKEREAIERKAYHETMAAHKLHYEQKGQAKTERELHKEVSQIQDKVAREKSAGLYRK